MIDAPIEDEASRMPPTKNLTFYPSACQLLERRGQTYVRGVHDSLSVGPSRVDPAAHGEVRSALWKHGFRDKDGRAILAKGDFAVCAWFEPKPRQVLAFLRACSLAALNGRRLEMALIHQFAGRRVDPPRPDLVDAPRPVSPRELHLGARLWEIFCGPDPGRFLGALDRADFPALKLSSLSRYCSAFFPRRSGARLRISRFDELLLSKLSTTKWVNSVAVFVANAKKPAYFWMAEAGDGIVPDRLTEWHLHSKGTLVERRSDHRRRRTQAMSADSFRLTAEGKRVLRELPSLEMAPPLPLGGAVAYDPTHPWSLRS